MRNLTIKRKKAYAGCVMKPKVYIEDPVANELIIKGIPCRDLRASCTTQCSQLVILYP